MTKIAKPIFGFAIVSVLVFGAYFSNQVVAGGGKALNADAQYLVFQQLLGFRAPQQPSLFDLQLQNANNNPD